MKSVPTIGDRLVTFVFVASCSVLCAQPLSLRQAIDLALAGNKTIIYSAQRAFASSRASLQSVEAAYASRLDFSLAGVHSYSKTSAESESYSPSFTTTTQSLLPRLDLSRALLTPLGSRTTIRVGLDASIYQYPSRTSQLVPQLRLGFHQPLSPAGVSAGHEDIIRARTNFSIAAMTFGLQEERLVLAVVSGYC